MARCKTPRGPFPPSARSFARRSRCPLSRKKGRRWSGSAHRRRALNATATPSLIPTEAPSPTPLPNYHALAFDPDLSKMEGMSAVPEEYREQLGAAFWVDVTPGNEPVTGYTLFRRFAEQYRQSYVDGAASTLDSMYITMPAQNLFYLGVLLGVFLYGVVAWLSGNLAAGIPFFLVGIWLPRFALKYLKKRRDEMFLIQLVDTLMNMSNSLRAGFSLNQALELIHREMPNPMSQEIRL